MADYAMAEGTYARYESQDAVLPPGQVMAAVEGLFEKAELLSKRIAEMESQLVSVLRKLTNPGPSDGELKAMRNEHSPLAERLFALDAGLARSAVQLATLRDRIDV